MEKRGEGKIQRMLTMEVVYPVALILFTIAIRFPTLLEPWGGDQSVFAYIASGILDGKTPYKELYSATGYGIFFTYATFFKALGTSMIALHVGDLFASLATVVTVYALSKVLFGMECAAIAGTVAAVFGSGQAFSGMVDMRGAWGTYWQLAQRETFMTPLIAGAVLCAILAERRQKGHLYIWAGMLIGLAAIYKITAVIMIVVLLIFILSAAGWKPSRRNLTPPLKLCAATIAGFIAVNLPFLFYFWQRGSLGEMYRAVFVHTSVYAKLAWGNAVADAFKGNTYVLSEQLILWIITPVAAIHLAAKERSREHILLCAWTAATLMMIWGQGKHFGYHFLLIIGPFCVLCGYGIKTFFKIGPTWTASLGAARNNVAQLCLWMLLIGNMLIFAWNQYEYYRWSILRLLGRIDKDAYYEVFNEYPLHLYSFRSNYEVVNYLKQGGKTTASLREINGGGENIINVLTGMRSATRFTSTWYLFNKKLYQDAITRQLRKEFIEGIKAEKPNYILLVYYSMSEFRREYESPEYGDVIELMDYIQATYAVDKAFRDGRVLYKVI